MSEIEKIRSTSIVFILGKGRSGTTLLQAMLNEHPNIVAPPESKFVMLLSSRFGHKKKWTKQDINIAVEALYSEFFFAKVWKPDKERLTSCLLSYIDKMDYSLFCKIVYYQMKGDKENVMYISDKNPIYSLFIDPLLEIFPDAKFIHIIRDPRDTVLSNMTTFGLSNTTFIAQQWFMDNYFIEEHKLKVPGRYFTVFYEKMVEDTEKVLAELCDFLKIPYSASMNTVKADTAMKAYEDYKELFDNAHKNILNPVSSTSVGKWKKEMKEKDIIMTETIAGRFAHSKYRYELSTFNKKGSFLKVASTKAVYYCWLPLARIRFRNYRLNRIYTNIRKAILGDKIAPWENTV